MKKNTIQIGGIDVDVYSLNTVVVGTGCAGFNAADSLYDLGQKDIAIVTEGVTMGTSRNTGSDKQTYYKLTLSGDAPDSVGEMAKTYFAGGAMHGDIALIESALSAPCFSKLARIGVPFPHNKYGEYIGYKTDHDPRQRATSAGPLTSKFMTEKLEKQVAAKKIKIFDDFLVISLLTEERSNGEKYAIGLLAIDTSKLNATNMGFTLFNCTNVIWAVGGPAGMYYDSVYPECQCGTSGMMYEAGAIGVNLTESQYGLASVKFRWNVSGTYQQVLPSYVSVNPDGSDPKEFLTEYFDSPGKMMDAIFLKGYQWPFDPRKVENGGSSLIDILVYNETVIKGRHVWLDFRCNSPECCKSNGELDFSLCGNETRTYLEKSGALFGKPIDRLAHMNPQAILLYKDHGIDLYTEALEIAVCAQHNNGGLLGNIWSESNIQHFFPVGEANGAFGVYRPGGSALNSTQVTSLRAAQFIAANYTASPLDAKAFAGAVEKQVAEKYNFACSLSENIMTTKLPQRGKMSITPGFSRGTADISTHHSPNGAIQNSGSYAPLGLEDGDRHNPRLTPGVIDIASLQDDSPLEKFSQNLPPSNLADRCMAMRQRMTDCGAHIRSLDKVEQAIRECLADIKSFASETKITRSLEIPGGFMIRDILISQYVYLCAIREYIRKGGGSRGSYLVQDKNGKLPIASLPETFRFSLDDGKLSESVCEIGLNVDSMECHCEWKPVRPIPSEDNWFENVWAEYRKGDVIK